MTKRQSSLERLGNFRVMIDDTTDEIVGLVDAHGNERKLVTAVTSPGGGMVVQDGSETRSLVTAGMGGGIPTGFFYIADESGERPVTLGGGLFIPSGVGDGVADDTAAVQASITASTGYLYIPGNKTYRITSGLTCTKSIVIYGEGTLLLDFTGGNGLVCNGSNSIVRLEGIKFDGNNKAATGVFLSAVDRAAVRNVKFVNFDDTTAARGLVIAAVKFWSVSGCWFEKIITMANGTIGDGIGPAMGIYATGTIENGIVEGCYFKNINNRDAAYQKVFEDADAISVQGMSGEQQSVKVLNNRFEDCGKRASKFNSANLMNSYEFSGNEVVSSYVGTPNDVSILGNGMWSVVSVFGGDFTARNNKMQVGVILYGFEVSGTLVRNIVLDGNVWMPEAHTFVNQQSHTRFLVVVGTTTTCRIYTARNRISHSSGSSGMTYGFYVGGAIHSFFWDDNDVNVVQYAVYLANFKLFSARGGRASYTGSGSSTSGGITLLNGGPAASICVSGVAFANHLGKSIDLSSITANQPAATVVGNTFFSSTTPISYPPNADTTWLTLSANRTPSVAVT